MVAKQKTPATPKERPTLRRLQELGVTFRAKKAAYDKLEKEIKALKVEIREVTEALGDMPALATEGPTSHITLDDGPKLTVTRSEPEPTPPLDAVRFLAAVGPEQFFRFCVVTKVASKDFDAEEWTRAVQAEEFTNDILVDCLGKAPNAKAWSVGIG